VKRLNKIVNFCVTSSIWVAISVTSLVGVTGIELSTPVNVNLMLFVFVGTIFGYNFIKYFETSQVENLKMNSVSFNFNYLIRNFKSLRREEKVTFIISLISLILGFSLLFKLERNTVLSLLIPIMFTFCYAVSLGNKTLRNISGIKIYVVAFVWAFVSVLLLALEGKVGFTTDIGVVFFQRFVFVVVLILPFEIRDLSVDEKHLCTFPQKYGVKRTKFYGSFLLLIFFLLEFFKEELSMINLIVLLLISLITLLLLILSSEKQTKHYSGFIVEGIPILWFCLLMFL